MDDTGRFFILMPQALFDFEDLISLLICKVGCVVVMVVVSILPHAEFGPNDHRQDAPHFKKQWLGHQYKNQFQIIYFVLGILIFVIVPSYMFTDRFSCY